MKKQTQKSNSCKVTQPASQQSWDQNSGMVSPYSVSFPLYQMLSNQMKYKIKVDIPQLGNKKSGSFLATVRAIVFGKEIININTT